MGAAAAYVGSQSFGDVEVERDAQMAGDRAHEISTSFRLIGLGEYD